MPAAVAIPLIVGAASAGSSIVGAKMASNASKRAADTQSASAADARTQTNQTTDRALSYLMNAQQGSRNPLGGSPAYTRMYQGLGLGMPQQPMAQSGTVMLRAPNGMTKAVPMAEADHYLQRGAQRV